LLRCFTSAVFTASTSFSMTNFDGLCRPAEGKDLLHYEIYISAYHSIRFFRFNELEISQPKLSKQNHVIQN
ncbi:MAG TPA: hypothetical protein DCM62_06020, partial [Bacteroidales bacterium]|nr:hypothetical protein [Bacteroidales bacterium]